MRRIALAATLLAVALAGCGASSDQSGSGAGDAAAPPAGAGAGAGQDRAGGNEGGGAKAVGAKNGLTDVAVGRAQIRSAAMTVHVDDVLASARAAVRVAEGKGGFLESEQTAGESTTLTLRVPPEDFTATSDALAALGAVTERRVSTEDVTSDVADVSGRLKAARASVARVRALLGRAGTISEITELEAELNEREAALESLESRQRSLGAQTAFASLTATFTKPPASSPVGEKDEDPADAGFLGGLRAGWGAFTATTTVVLAMLGAVLPFAGLAALVGGPYYLLRRRVSARA